MGEAEGLLWAAKAELSGAMEEMNGLLTKIDLGLNYYGYLMWVIQPNFFNSLSIC